MSTPLSTIADALIEFILSLLRDPDAAAEFEAAPEEVLEREGMGDVRVDDVRSVVPVVVDRPDVVYRPSSMIPAEPRIITVPVVAAPAAAAAAAPAKAATQSVINEIMNVVNNFNIDARTTIIDQSVNQNIWAEGDVTQIFDQEAVVASGDNAIAAGEDILTDNSQTEISADEVEIGNTETTTTIVDSFNDESTTTQVSLDATIEDSFNVNTTQVTVDTVVQDSFQNASSTTVSTTTDMPDSVELPDPTDIQVDAPISAEEAPIELEEAPIPLELDEP